MTQVFLAYNGHFNCNQTETDQHMTYQAILMTGLWSLMTIRLMKESQHTGQALGFGLSSCDHKMAYSWNFSVYQECLVAQGSVMHSDSIFINFCKYFVNIKTLIY
jgi:hypothetical protein